MEFILGEPIRNVTAVAVKHREQHTHQFTPANVTLDPVEAHERFEQMRKNLTQ